MRERGWMEQGERVMDKILSGVSLCEEREQESGTPVEGV
jgi:hypothetical protein